MNGWIGISVTKVFLVMWTWVGGVPCERHNGISQCPSVAKINQESATFLDAASACQKLSEEEGFLFEVDLEAKTITPKKCKLVDQNKIVQEWEIVP